MAWALIVWIAFDIDPVVGLHRSGKCSSYSIQAPGLLNESERRRGYYCRIVDILDNCSDINSICPIEEVYCQRPILNSYLVSICFILQQYLDIIKLVLRFESRYHRTALYGLLPGQRLSWRPLPKCEARARALDRL